jgi:putative ABC transport system ATP-binding protein
VRIVDVVKSYGEGDSTVEVLRGVDLEIRRGEILAIIGASGSGKTTLMNLLGLLDRPDRGRYELDGEDVARLSDDRLARLRNRAIGFVFQSFHLIPEMSVLDNVELPGFYMRLPRRERRRRGLELLESVGLSHRLRHRPSQLSGGECQRVAVARSLLADPYLLLADEPTGNLDSKSGEEVLGLFHDLHAQGRTIVMVTHNPQIAGRLERVVEMQDGRVVADHPQAVGV